MRSSYFNPQNKKAVSYDQVVKKSDRNIMRAWELFVEHGQNSEEIKSSVRSDILASWDRCKNSGVSALSTATPKIVDDNNVYLLRKKNRSLCDAARLAFKSLSPHLTGTGAILILTDKSGTIVEAIGDSQTLDAGREIRLEVGGVWDERVIGTNGIGTALSTGMPTYVHASEHFCSGIKSWTCVGVPIIDALDRSVLGVINLSGPSSIYRPHNVALVVATAREIELNLAQQQSTEHTALLEEFIGYPKHQDHAIVLLNSAGKIVYSRNTEYITFEGQEDYCTGSKLLDFYPEMPVTELEAALPPNLPTKDIELIQAGGKTLGVALFLQNQKDSTSETKKMGISIKPRAGVAEENVEIVGDSPQMKEAIKFARRAAEMNVPVLIQGETGVGKELFARLIHSQLTQLTTPYVVVNCATISPDLIRNELFGAISRPDDGPSQEDKLGKFEQANGGVLCLDEIGDMPFELQTYLLRALEQRAVYRVGSDIRRPIDVQPIAMTSRNIRKDIESGRFRRDLFYRIGTIVINIPPLRDRGQDIDLLIEYFNIKLSNKYARSPLAFNTAALAALHHYSWPGNVRELRNVIERLCLLDSHKIVVTSDLPAEIVHPESINPLSDSDNLLHGANCMDLDEIESIAVQNSIDMANGNLTKAAATLGISRPTLYRKIKLYGLDRKK